MPFGWNGDPAHFAYFGDAITKAHVQCGLARALTPMKHAFRSVMYAGDGIFAEVAAPERMAASTQCWEHLAKGILGRDAINEEKLGTEGTWESQQILLDFIFNLDELTITIHEEKIACAKILFSKFFDMAGSQFATLLEMQQLRGHIEHFQSTSEIWKLVK